METILEQFKNMCPDLTWDRYTESESEYTCFGWIKRSDGNRDFLVLNFTIGDILNDVWFCTSSAKYSEKFAQLTNSEHSNCKKLHELP